MVEWLSGCHEYTGVVAMNTQGGCHEYTGVVAMNTQVTAIKHGAFARLQFICAGLIQAPPIVYVYL